MTEDEKDRLIELLINVFDEASESEGIYFTSNQHAVEIMQFIVKMRPHEAKKWQEQIDYMKDRYGIK